MSYWKDEISACFDDESLVFAAHPEEEKQAWALREKVRQQGIPDEVIRIAFDDWLHEQSSNTGHIYEQMERAREFFEV